MEGLRRRLADHRAHGSRRRSATGSESAEVLRAEVRRLEQQNERLRTAMRHCIDCEYRVEVVARRDAAGATADGSSADGSFSGRFPEG